MQKFHAFFHKRPKEGKHRCSYDVDEQSWPPQDHKSSHNGSRSCRSPARLGRSPVIRRLRYSDDSFVPRISLNGADHSANPASILVSGRCASTPSYMHSQVGSPLPSPPRSPTQGAIQASTPWPLPSPRQLPRKNEDHQESSGFPSDNLANGDEFLPAAHIGFSEGDTNKSTISPSNFHGLPSPKAISVSASSHIGGGGDAHTHGDAQPGTPIGRYLSPVRSPRTVGTPVTSSPPLSPSAAQASSPGRWLKGRLLGSGAFGKVYKGIHSETGEFCAIKEVELVQNDPRSTEAAKQLEKEINSLIVLKHPNIVQYKGSEMVGDSLYIYLELVSGGSLYKLYQEFKLEEPVIRRYTRQILLGLQYLHKRKFVHRDIKCANILVDQDGTIKLADFGVAKHIKGQGVPFSMKGSPHWMAPEVIMSRNTGYEYAVDIWSLGCTVIEMFTRKPPWGALEAAAVMFKVTKIGAPPIPEGLSADGQDFLSRCLRRNPADRPTASFLLRHQFVQIQNDCQDATLHAFDALNDLDLGETHLSSPRSPGPGVCPSLSAPTSPRSSRIAVGELYSAQSDLTALPQVEVGRIRIANSEQNEMYGNSSVLPQRKLRKPRQGRDKTPVSPSRHRQSNQFVHAHAQSAPVSPKSSDFTLGNLHPTRSANILPGYPTPFSEYREHPLDSSEVIQGFAASRHNPRPR